ncbi:MAG: patatin-like phospholipase family protein [Anaerolineaceae bacterium]|nr:patatin-like phospholipase family protein [Anaerolineaceae bacterium]
MSIFDFLRKKKPVIGLALSGGSTRGAAHLGVLKVLEREGIRPDIVAGTSAGALVGAAYCAGVPLDEITRMFLTMSWPTLLKPNLNRPLSLFDTSPMEEYIRKNIGDCEFKDLQIPFAAIACDIMTGERIVLDKGQLAPAIRASASIPGLFSPVEIDGRLLVDGGTVDNFPVEQAKAMGATYIIGVNLSKSQASGRRPTNPFDMFMDMVNIMQARSAVADASECNCYIRPEVSMYSSWTFGEADKMLEAGVAATEAVVPQLRKDLKLNK